MRIKTKIPHDSVRQVWIEPGKRVIFPNPSLGPNTAAQAHCFLRRRAQNKGSSGKRLLIQIKARIHTRDE